MACYSSLVTLNERHYFIVQGCSEDSPPPKCEFYPIGTNETFIVSTPMDNVGPFITWLVERGFKEKNPTICCKQDEKYFYRAELEGLDFFFVPSDCKLLEPISSGRRVMTMKKNRPKLYVYNSSAFGAYMHLTDNGYAPTTVTLA